MSDMLYKICEEKRAYITECRQRMPLAVLEQQALGAPPCRGFHRALKEQVAAGKPALIAEIKKASPSKGLIRADFDPATLARAYAQGGATCLSVLTDIPYFLGDDRYLQQARAVTALPVLRKDFMLDPYQVIEARALGADCILLIMAALDDTQAAELEATAHTLGMDVLVELHDETETARALTHLRSRLLGINNRNLKTLAVDLATAERLRPLLPADATAVCESGIATPADIARMRAAHMHCFLVGESLMRQADVAAATRTLLDEA